MIVELPRDVRDVMVSNPEQIEAVLQSSRRAYLIGKRPGEANILFTDKDGNQVATLEVTIERDLTALGDLLNRLLPNSHIAIQTVGERVVLTGTVTSPLNSTRASEIVRSFLGTSGSSGGTATSSGGGAAVTINNSSSGGGGGGGSGDDSGPSDVINMLTVEGREQVLLKVSVVEMERNIVKQFGVDLERSGQFRQFRFRRTERSSLPHQCCRQGRAGAVSGRAERGDQRLPGHRRSVRSDRRQSVWLRRPMAERREPRAERAPGAGGRRPVAYPRRAEPDGDFRRDGEFPRWRRIPHSDRPAARHHLGRVQEIRHRPGLHAGRHVGGPHQLEGLDGSQRAQQ